MQQDSGGLIRAEGKSDQRWRSCENLGKIGLRLKQLGSDDVVWSAAAAAGQVFQKVPSTRNGFTHSTVVEEIDLSLNLNLSDAWDWWFFRLSQAGVQKTFKEEREKIFKFHTDLVQGM